MSDLDKFNQAVADLRVELVETGVLADLSKWDSLDEVVKNIGQVRETVGALIVLVEVAADNIGEIQGKEKQEKVAELLDDLFSFPIWLEFLDGFIFEMLIAVIVNGLNSRFGTNWVQLLSLREKIKSTDNFLKFLKQV